MHHNTVQLTRPGPARGLLALGSQRPAAPRQDGLWRILPASLPGAAGLQGHLSTWAALCPLPAALLKAAATPGPRQAEPHLGPCASGRRRGSGGAWGTEVTRTPRWRGHGDLGRPRCRRSGRAPRALQPRDAPTSPAGVDASLPAAGPAAPSDRLCPQAPSPHPPGTRPPAATCGREA